MNYFIVIILLVLVIYLTTSRESFTEAFGLSGYTKPIGVVKLDDPRPDLSKYTEVEVSIDNDNMEEFVLQANKEISKRTGLCTYIIEYINKVPQLKQLVSYHNINTQGIPQNYKNKINRVPTMLTKNGKILVGNEIKNWLDSLLPKKEVENGTIGGFGGSMFSLEGGDNNSDMFRLDDYGQSLQPAMTKELEEKINREVSKGVAYTDIKM